MKEATQEQKIEFLMGLTREELIKSWEGVRYMGTPGTLIAKAREYAIEKHEGTNHRYDGNSYATHLSAVHGFAVKYIHLVHNDMREEVLAACWTHDIIEDARQTYNDVKERLGSTVAEITYALTNLKGRTREERAGNEYYTLIRETGGARFVKICDRLANAKYSTRKGSNLGNGKYSKMYETYRNEQSNFIKQLYTPLYNEMFIELNEILEV